MVKDLFGLAIVKEDGEAEGRVLGSSSWHLASTPSRASLCSLTRRSAGTRSPCMNTNAVALPKRTQRESRSWRRL